MSQSLWAAPTEDQRLGGMNSRLGFLTVWRLQSKNKAPADLVSGEGRLLVLAVSSHGGREGSPALSVVRAQILLGAPPSPPRHLPEAYLLIPSLWGLCVNMSFRGQTFRGQQHPCFSHSFMASRPSPSSEPRDEWVDPMGVLVLDTKSAR